MSGRNAAEIGGDLPKPISGALLSRVILTSGVSRRLVGAPSSHAASYIDRGFAFWVILHFDVGQRTPKREG